MSFRTRITLVTSALVFAVTAVTLASVLKLADTMLRRELGNQLLTLVTSAALMIDGDQHATLKSPDQMSGATYKNIKGLLIRLQRANADRHVKYVYTMVRTRDAGTYAFVVDSDEASGARLGDPYDAKELPELLAAFNGPVAEPDFTRDKWGLSLSAFAPIYDSGGLPVAIVGADAAVGGLAAMRSAVVNRLSISLLVGLVLAFGAGIYSGRVLARPLDDLVGATERVSRGDYERPFSLQAPAEFARVGEALNRMVAGLKERDVMRSTLERYVSGPVAQRILKEPGRVILAGEHRTITVLFSSVRGLEWDTEHMSPEEVLKQLNEYFSRMIDAVFLHEGSLDKFVGDGMMCHFGAPIEHEDDPDRAVRAAVAMQREAAWINASRRSAGLKELRLGIGIHTGPVVAGNVGSERRLEYGVVGDTVNLGNHVQEEAAAGQVLITEATWEHVKKTVACLELDPRPIKGKPEPVVLLSVLGTRVRGDDIGEDQVRLRPGTPLSVRCLLPTGADAGRVLDLRGEGLTVLGSGRIQTASLEIALPEEDGGPLSAQAERVSTAELDPVEPGFRFVHHLRFVRLADADRDRLVRALWRAAVSAPGLRANDEETGPPTARRLH